MTGLGMLLRALGVEVDPAQIGDFIAEAQVQIPAFLQRMQAAANRVDARMERLERNQKLIMKALDIAEPEPETELFALQPGAHLSARPNGHG